MLLVVVDTNIFINAIFRIGYKSSEQILDLEESKDIRFVFSRVTQNELMLITSRMVHELGVFDCYEVFESLLSIVKRSMFIEKVNKLPKLSTDKGDQPFIELAVHANVQFLITDDYSNGLLSLGTYNNVNIVNSSEFVKRYNKILRTGTSR